MFYNKSEMKFTSFDPEVVVPSKVSSKRKVLIAAASLISIAVIVCVAIAVCNQSSSTSEVVSSQSKFLPSNSSLNSETNKLNVASSILEMTAKKLFGLSASKKHKNHDFQHIAKLVSTYAVNLLDEDSNQTVEKAEWISFVKGIFAQDAPVLIPLYDEINGGQPFNQQQLMEFSLNKYSKIAPQSFTLQTPRRDYDLAFKKLVILNDQAYEQTYTLLFQIFDKDSNQQVSKSEFETVLTFLEGSKKQAKVNTENFLNASIQEKLSDGKVVNWAEYRQYALNLQSTLKKEVSSQITEYKLENEKSNILLNSLSESFSDMFFNIHNTTIMESADGEYEPSEEEKQIQDHFFQTVTTYEFNLLDLNENHTVAKEEFEAVVDQILKNQADQIHFENYFEKINDGKSFNLEQFQVLAKKFPPFKKVKSPYETQEKLDVIQKRIAQFLIKSDNHFLLTYNSFFHALDLDGNKVVEQSEAITLVKTVIRNEYQQSLWFQKIKKAFQDFKTLKVGNGEKISLAQWVAFAKKNRANFLKRFG